MITKPPILTDEQITALTYGNYLNPEKYTLVTAQRDDTFRETLRMVGEWIEAEGIVLIKHRDPARDMDGQPREYIPAWEPNVMGWERISLEVIKQLAERQEGE